MSGEETGMRPGATRRAFIGTGVAGAAFAAVGAAPAEAKKHTRKRYSEKKRVDLHSHYISPQYRQALTAAGITKIGGIPIPAWSPELAITFMNAHGIAIQMLSVSDPGVDFLDAGPATALAKNCNDYVAGLKNAHPKRFGGFAVLSLQDVAAARAEAIRALDTLKLDGVGLLSSTDGKYLGDPAFDAVLSELDKRKAWVFVHPKKIDGYGAAPEAGAALPQYQLPPFLAEYPFDTTRTILSLIFNDTFERFPNIRWQFAHGGGTIAMLRFRIEVLARLAPQAADILGMPAASKKLTARKADKALRGFHYDTALIADVPALDAVSGMTKTSNIVFGSDWPFANLVYDDKVFDPAPALSEVFSVKERHAIERLNGRREFKRLRFLPAK